MAQRGRRRVNLREKILEELAEHNRRLEDAIVEPASAWILEIARDGWRLAAEANRLLRGIDNGTAPYVISGTQQFREIESFAQKNGPFGQAADVRKFLQDFVKVWKQGDRESELENQQIAKDAAEDERKQIAAHTKHHTPDIPDAGLILDLPWEFRQRLDHGICKTYPVAQWPTLRQLKLATALPERVIKRTIDSLRPQKGEIQLRERSTRGGGMPRCYGPRLVDGVLDEFLKRLADFPMSNDEREACRKAALAAQLTFKTRARRRKRK
jgi:hypothetical protein